MRVVTMILAGGRGGRLGMLTQGRAKPALPIAGHHRIIDFSLSNSINSGIADIGILGAYRADSIDEHFREAGGRRAWGAASDIQLLVTDSPTGVREVRAGTAGAVLGHLSFLEERDADTVLILSGDQVYRMDYRPLLRFHAQHEADLTLASVEVPAEETTRFGIIDAASNGSVRGFQEKPERASSRLANMGVYVFRVTALREALAAGHWAGNTLDFSRQIIPHMLKGRRVYAYHFDGAWWDVGTPDAYWGANMALVSRPAALDLDDPAWPIYGRSSIRSAACVGQEACIQDSIVSGDCEVRGNVVRSVLSPGVYVAPGAVVSESVILEDCWIGPGAVVERCVLDRNVRVNARRRLGGRPYISPLSHRLTGADQPSICLISEAVYAAPDALIGPQTSSSRLDAHRFRAAPVESRGCST